MILELFRKDVRLRMCVWTLDRLASVEFFLWNSVPSPDSLSLPDVPLAFPLHAGGRQADSTVMCLGRLLRSRLVSVPLPLLR